MSDKLSRAVRAALGATPASLKAIAQESGVPLRTLHRIQRGERQASPAVAQALAQVLARWGSSWTWEGRRLLDTQNK